LRSSLAWQFVVTDAPSEKERVAIRGFAVFDNALTSGRRRKSAVLQLR
jgi:hypothetical protein